MQAATRKRILIEVILDTSDPWSYVGKRRLDEVICASKDVYDVQVRVLPCVLDASLPSAEAIRWLNRLPREPGHFSEDLWRCARKVSLTSSNFRNNNIARRANTVQSHALLRYTERVSSLATQSKLLDLIFNSFLGNGPYPHEETLVVLAKSVGLEPDAARSYMQSRQAHTAIRKESNEYVERGVKQLPFFVMNGKAIMAGFVRKEQLLECFEKCPCQPPQDKILDPSSTL